MAEIGLVHMDLLSNFERADAANGVRVSDTE